MENKKNTNVTKILSLIVLLAAVLFGVKEIGPVSDSSTNDNQVQQQETQSALTFRNANLLNQHYQKHGIEMGFASAEEYEAAA
ncbi:MAG: hypothetical protein ACI4HI_01845 [Lachnospiraceae bacterium]